jgi:hypothetical protein
LDNITTLEMVKDEASISFHKTCYKASEEITGDIYINVNWERKVEMISLQFIGYEVCQKKN